MNILRTAVCVACLCAPSAAVVVIHVALGKSSEDICRELGEAGLPNLWIPSPDSFMQVEEIPVLGTGKLDLKQLQQAALERFS